MKKLLLLLILLAVPAFGQKPRITDAQLLAALSVPYSQISAALFPYDSQSVAEAFERRYPGCSQHGFMHTTDHESALVCLLEREPTGLEVNNSWCITGSAKINEANRKCGGPVESLLGCLSRTLGVSNGSRVYERIYFGEVGLVKGRYAGVPYDCSMWPLPNAVPPPVEPEPVPDPPAPVCPPVPVKCNPFPLSEITRAKRMCQEWKLSPWQKTSACAQYRALMDYEPCPESTGRLEMNLRTEKDRLAP